jgi:peptidoglycan hydrolase-like protein with peptidoglycan-binding domain
MKRIRAFTAAAAALAAACGIALLPALTSAPPASAQASCTGTSLIPTTIAGLGGTVAVSIRVPTVGNGTGNWDCDLGLGNEGVAVSRLQIALDSANCNHDAGLTVDGIYGPLTQQAVINIQNVYFLTPDGIYGPQTGHAMQWPVAGSNGTECARIPPALPTPV